MTYQTAFDALSAAIAAGAKHSSGAKFYEGEGYVSVPTNEPPMGAAYAGSKQVLGAVGSHATLRALTASGYSVHPVRITVDRWYQGQTRQPIIDAYRAGRIDSETVYLLSLRWSTEPRTCEWLAMSRDAAEVWLREQGVKAPSVDAA